MQPSRRHARASSLARCAARRRVLPFLSAVTLLCAAAPGAALAATTATMTASFAPNRLGASAAITVGFRLHSPAGQIPSPLTGLEIHYPTNLGIVTTGLGVATCPVVELEAHGAAVCPPDSIMGSGNASVELRVDGTTQTETAGIAMVAAPSPDGYVHLSTTATGLSPVIARIVIPSTLLTGRMSLAVPLVEGLPGAPDVSVVGVSLTLGGALTYYETIRGRTVPYRPVGIGIPRSCPRGGFPFSTDFAFLDGGHARARTVVACPRG